MDQLMNFIIRPPRANYNPRNDLLDKEFMLRGRLYQRKDIEIKNCRGEILQCSHYMPLGNSDAMPLPCVIYCHGNSGCRADASEAAIVLLPSNITVFALDFSGSGLSGGEYVTLGWNEKDDLRAIVEYLRQDGNVSLIGLWGRSMGAVTSLMYGAEDPSIAGIVLDSPFSNLEELMLELVGIYAARFPKFTVKFAIQILRRAIQKKAKFDIMELNTIKAAKTCFSPVLFGHATDDDFIKPHHSDHIYDVYMGDKNIIKFEGDHNSARPPFYFDSINIFFHNVLQPPLVEWGETYTDTMHCFFTKASGANLQGAANPDSSDASKVAEPSSSPSDVGELVQPKRPMSRMEIPPDISLEENEPKAKAVSNDIIDKEAEHDQLSSSKEKGFEQQPSSHPCTPHDPTMKHDDAYSAFKLNNFTGFPCSAEEEERMVMEAVIMSLKDLKMQNSYVVPEEASVSSSANIEPDPDASSVTGH